MAKQIDLIAEAREDSGKGASRRLRRAGKVPAIVYGGGLEPRAVAFEQQVLLHRMESESFFSSVLNVKIGNNTRQCILKAVQMHPAKRMAMHLDLQRIVADELIRMTVPIHFLNEAISPGVKTEGGTVSHLLTEIAVSCLPASLPEYLELDLKDLKLDESLLLSDIKLPEGVEIPDLTNDLDQTVVTIHIVKAQVIEEDEDEADADAEESDAAAAKDDAKDKDKDKDEG